MFPHELQIVVDIENKEQKRQERRISDKKGSKHKKPYE
jgi:hypothetical protein